MNAKMKITFKNVITLINLKCITITLDTIIINVKTFKENKKNNTFILSLSRRLFLYFILYIIFIFVIFWF